MPRCCAPAFASKRNFDLLTEIMEGNNGSDKNFNYDLFYFIKALLRYSRWADKRHVWKSEAVEDVPIDCVNGK